MFTAMTIAISEVSGGRFIFGRRLESPIALASIVFVAALVWTLLVRLPLFWAYASDEAGFIGIAHLWTRGVLPYAGVFDVKPPGLFALLVAAEAVFGATLEALRAVSIVSDAATATALFWLARRFGDARVGVFAAILYPVLSQVAINYDAYSPLVALTTVAFPAALSPLALVPRAGPRSPLALRCDRRSKNKVLLRKPGELAADRRRDRPLIPSNRAGDWGIRLL